MGEDVEAVTVDEWKQLRYHFGEFLKKLEAVDTEAFRDEFVENELEAALLDLAADTADG